MRYAGDAYLRASGTRDAFGRLSDRLVSEGLPEFVVNDGDREQADQERVFLDRYDPSSGPRDVGPYNDRRFWPGHGWFKRVSDEGPVAVPGSSNHQKRRSADLGYPYSANTAAHRRAQQLAPEYNITCEGLTFSQKEWWHWTSWGGLGTIDGAASGAGEAEDDMPTEAWLNGLGKSIIDQTVAAVKADINTVHQAVLTSRVELQNAVAAIRADLNYVHVLSPYSLKAILEASKSGTVHLTDAQAAAIGGQLSTVAVTSLVAALEENEAAVLAELRDQPAEFVEALRDALNRSVT